MAKQYVIKPGDCVASVALEHGFRPETLWEDAGNAGLREQRASGYLLVPGDVLAVPDPRPKQLDCETGQRHSFRRLGVPEKLQIRLEEDGLPRANLDYVLIIDGKSSNGRTDGDGKLEAWISPNARQGELRIDGEAPVPIMLGRLAPVTEDQGVCDRLINLGHLAADDIGDAAQLRFALLDFQTRHALPSSGEADDQTRAALVEAHGC